MNFIDRVLGVFSSPRRTLESVAEKPVWWDVLVVVLVSMLVYSALIMPYATQEALANYQSSTGTPPPDFNQMPKWVLAIGLIVGLFSIVVMIFLTCGIIYLVGRLFSTAGDFAKIVAVYLHAGLVDSLLGNAVRLTLTLMKKSIRVSTSLAVLLPAEVPLRSFWYILFSQFDFFRLWAFGILAFGLSAVFKVDRKKALGIAFLSWLILTLLAAGLSGLGLVLQKRR
jgi:hypothetical protein